MNPVNLLHLQRYSGLKLSELTAAHCTEMADIFGVQLRESLVAEVLELVRSEDDQAVLDWVFNPTNLDRFKKMVLQERQKNTFLVACPECGKVTVKSAMTIAAVEPHVVCNHCGHSIEIS
jgi:predicted RNA-binding Zn-ribbon protein involved in translation (DUF1610 family)